MTTDVGGSNVRHFWAYRWAIRAVEVDFEVVGFDIDKTRIDCLRKAETYIDDITDGDLAIAMSTGRYLPSDDPSALAGFDVAVVCVPTPLRDGVPGAGLAKITVYVPNATEFVVRGTQTAITSVLAALAAPYLSRPTPGG